MAVLTVCITNMDKNSKGRNRVYTVNNYGQALGIIRCCLTRWSGMGHIFGFKADGTLVDEYFVVENVRIVEIDSKQAKFYNDIAFNRIKPYVEETRMAMTYNVYNITIEEPQKSSLFRKAIDWVKGLF